MLGDALAGSNRPLVVSAGLPPVPGRPSNEDDELPAHQPMPRISERSAIALVPKGVRATVIRLPQVHDREKAGLVTHLIAHAREKGVSAYVGEGRNRWPAIHKLDVGPLYRLALEKGTAGARYHAVAEEGVPLRQIAEAIGRRWNLPVVAIRAAGCGIFHVMEAGTFHCPSCGASIAGDSTLCAYCGSQLQSVACASCFGMMFVGSRFCPHCGAAAAVVDRGAAANHPCPRCAGRHLQAVDVAGVSLEECPGCGGLWVAADVFNQICADRTKQEAAIAAALPPASASSPVGHPSPVEHSAMYLKCPACSTLMNRFQFAQHSGVVLDKCRAHGIWLDRDELRRVVEFIRAGGLTMAREREIEQLKRQREGLELDRMTTTPDSGSLPGPRHGCSPYAGDNTGIGWIEAIAGILTSFLE